MLPAAAAAAAILNLLVPRPASAADPYANVVSTISTLEHPREDVQQELIVQTPHKAASPKISPVLGVGLLVALSTALFLLLRCIQRLSSSQKEASGASVRRLADKDGEGDECDMLEEALVSGSEGEDETEGAAGGGEPEEAAVGGEPSPLDDREDPLRHMEDGFHIPEGPDPYLEGPDPIPPAGSPFPPADPPVTLDYGETIDRSAQMTTVSDLVEKIESTGWESAEGRTMPGLLREAFECYKKNANASFGPDVPDVTAHNFTEGVRKMMDILTRLRGLVSGTDSESTGQTEDE